MVGLLGLQRDRQGRNAKARRLQGGADGARDGDAAADVLAVIDARDDQVGLARQDLHDRMQDRLGGRAADGVHGPVFAVNAHLFQADGAVGGGGEAAPGAGGLVARGGDMHVTDFGQGRRRGPQAGRADAVIVGEQDLRFFLFHKEDKTNLSRYFSEAPWFEEQVNQRRIHYLLEQTKAVRKSKEASALILDDTLCKHVGSLFEYVARHYDHSDNSYPLAHNPVTSHYVSGPVRFPVDLRIYRRYEELTRWEEFVHKHFPEREIPAKKKERNHLHREADPVLLEKPRVCRVARAISHQN